MGLSETIKIGGCLWIYSGWWIIAAAGIATEAANCNITIGNYSYTEEILVSDVQYARGLAMDFSRHTLYFHFYNELPHSAKMDLRNKTVTAIEELSGICLFTVDQVRGFVYAGCSTYDAAPGGLYQLDTNTGRFELVGEEGQNVQFVIYYNDTLFYCIYDEYLFHTFVKGHSAVVAMQPSEVWNWVFNWDNGLIIYDKTATVTWGRGRTKTTHKEGYNSKEHAFAVDHRGVAYVCHDGFLTHGLWLLQKHTNDSTRLVEIMCQALTFDADDNIIYGDSVRHSLVRLEKC